MAEKKCSCPTAERSVQVTMDDNITVIEKNRKADKRKRKNKASNCDRMNQTVDASVDSQPEEDLNKEHSYAGAKSEKKRKRLSMQAVGSEYSNKANKSRRTVMQSESSDACASKVDASKTFKCDKCGSLSITNPMIRGNRLKKSRYMPSPRRKVDPETNKILCLCNACGLAFGRTKKVRKNQSPPSLEEKQKYLDDGQRFAKLLAEELDNKEAERLYCTYFTKTPCGCIQRYIGNDKSVSSMEKAKTLLEIMAKAKYYKSFKVYENTDENLTQNNADNRDNNGLNNKQKKSSKKNHIGLGNGHKKSVKFEKYVLEQRAWLKKKFGFCETGTKRVLLYSNNFLHKRLKTDPEKSCRVARQKGLAALGKLVSIKDLPKEECCADNCVRMASTHQTLLQEWRNRSISGQSEARRVIAEMLTPSGGSRTNCYKFVSSVTGCSLTTIGKVMEQMKKTGGNREPPKHGLIKYWKENPKPKKDKNDTKPAAKTTSPVFTKDNAPAIFPTAAFVHSYGILQAAANSSGLAAVMQGQQPQQQQQQNQTVTHNPQTNTTVITVTATPYPQSFIGFTGQGNSLAIPMNALQMQNFQIQQQVQQPQFQLIQPQSQQQQQQQQQSSQTVAIAVNQVARQQVTTPTMVSTASTQPGAFVLAPATSTFIETDNCIPSLITTPQQLTQVNSPQGSIQLPTQLLLTHSQGASLMPSNYPPNIISLVTQAQPQHGSANGSIAVVPASVSSTTEQFLSPDNVGLLSNNNTATQVPVSQFEQLI